MSKLSEISFHNPFVERLPGEESGSLQPRQVTGATYSLTKPTPVQKPELIGWSQPMAELFKLEKPLPDSKDLKILAGNDLHPDMKPFAAVYGGHQFGHWAGQLGDGRAINLGEMKDLKGERWELQLKGAGPTPFSRTADGRAVLRSSIREFLASEAMFGLGIPTTRVLSLVRTGDDVLRDMFYNGNPQMEPGAIVSRVAPSFLRFGNFEILASRGDQKLLKQLADWTILNHFPEVNLQSKTVYQDWFEVVCRKTAILMSEWLRVGFVHGVMNTDNLSILGLTIDYGPYGWLDTYDPLWTPNTTDLPGRRYSYARQPAVAHWNLERLAEAVAVLVDEPETLASGLDAFRSQFQESFKEVIANKLGLIRDDGNLALFEELTQIIQSAEVDPTIFFRRLSDFTPVENGLLFSEQISESFYQTPSPQVLLKMVSWMKKYQARLRQDKLVPEQRKATMNRANPKYILRNYMNHQAIEAATKGDYSVLEELQTLLKNPYDEQPNRNKWAKRRPEWARDQAGCSALSCSS